MKDYSYVTNAHPEYIDSLYTKFKTDPNSVDEGWKLFFEGFEYQPYENGHSAIGVLPSNKNGSSATLTSTDLEKEMSVLSLIHGFRNRGHLLSTTNPIRDRKDRQAHLRLADYNLSESDFDTVFAVGEELHMGHATLRQILDRLIAIYSGNIGFEYTYVEKYAQRKWLRERIESRDVNLDHEFSIERKRRILDKLNGAVIFEKFLHTKYIGQKRFSLEGGETTIAALDAIITKGASLGVQEFVIGMAHRGRLNVLANIMGKTYENIFSEFEGNQVPDMSLGDGDVKYHLGYSSLTEVDGKKVNLKLMPNPSHLESVDPVVEGYVRAKIDSFYGGNEQNIVPILIHGDAAVAGQGVVYETVQMSQLEGFKTGGTIHFVINNQIGFTTDFEDGRSSTYCTAAAAMVLAPVFHVNGDDPEAVVWATELAVAYRQTFHSDVFIDMVCYRRQGHNEGDDPKFTQPQMYAQIDKHEDPREVYSKKLVSRGEVQAQLAQELEDNFWTSLQERLDQVRQESLPYEYQAPEQEWRKLKKQASYKDFTTSPDTGIEMSEVQSILAHLQRVPDGMQPLGKVNRLLKSMRALIDKNEINWGTAELMAYASILLEGKDVRLTGQDVQRGTFSHRHAILKDSKTFAEYNRLSDLHEGQGRFFIYNSLLSEFAVLGYEYGYALANPHTLNLWEAQFGDFYNGAQTIVDQYISAGESKWRRMNGLVMLLPHGYEGQGPEHSSARLERFLQSCAEFNMIVANITTPANFFHILRRQLAWPFRKPLVIMSPKSLLRHPACVSAINDFGKGNRFMEVIDDSMPSDEKSNIKRLILCTGKIYYELDAYRQEHDIREIAIIRIEQLYPLDIDALDVMMAAYQKAEVYWVQEEPENMGAWTYIAMNLTFVNLKRISRKRSASPATGFKHIHDEVQAQLIKDAMTLDV